MEDNKNVLSLQHQTNKQKHTIMTNQERKQVAKRYYISVSRNEIISARMSPVSKGDVVLKVYNPVFQTEGNVTIGVRPEFNELLLCVDDRVYGSSTITKYL